VLGLRIAANGSMPVTCPWTSWKPAGVFIQEFALTTNQAEVMPLMRMGIEVS
jgi:hypothetical protein